MDWYRRYVGTCADAKIAEAAMVAEAPRCLVIAVWDSLLESACDDEANGAYSTTARRIAAVLVEPVARVAAVLDALTEIGMIAGGAIVAWDKRQPNSATPAGAAERQRRARAARAENSAENAGVSEALSPAKAGSGDMSRPVTACHGEPVTESRAVTASHALEGEEETEQESLPRQAREARSKAGSNVVGFDRLSPLGQDALEAELRVLLGTLPVVVDPDFSPIRKLLDEGLTRGDVLAGASAIIAKGFRPRDWSGLTNSIRYAAKDRIAASLPGIRDGPRRAAKRSAVSIFQEIGNGGRANAGDGPKLSGEARAGPVIDGRAVAL